MRSSIIGWFGALLLLSCGGDVGGPSAPGSGTGAGTSGTGDTSDDGSSTGGSDSAGGGQGSDDPGESNGSGSNGGAGDGTGAPGSESTPGGGSGAVAGEGDPGAVVGGSTGEQGGSEAPPALACSEPALGKPALRLLTKLELENTLNDIFPEVRGQWTTALPTALSGHGFDNDAGAELGNQATELMFETASSVATAVAGSALSGILPCSTSSADRACAESYLEQYGRRLFRRSLSAVEKDRYLSLFDSALDATDFATAIKWVTIGLVQSPNAIYRSELGTGSGPRTLTPAEIATQLAYTFTGSTPSEELLTQAESGALGDPVATARSMLATERGRQQIHRFFELYTGYARTSAKTKPNATTGSTSYGDVAADMVEETRKFIEQVVFTDGGSWTDLLTAPTTYPSQDLANFYGLPAPSADYASVERPEGRGIGLLAQGSFLATHANPDGSSPTQRGLFVYERMLCQPDPPLPDIVPNLGEPQPGQRTTRQRYEDLHAADPACAGCHALFDPFGFAFEHYDEAGRYREDEAGLPIDSTGQMRLPSGTTLTFANLEELASGLAADATVQECFAAYMAIYAFGSSDACIGSSQVGALQSGEIGIAEAFAALAGEPHFTQRSAE